MQIIANRFGIEVSEKAILELINKKLNIQASKLEIVQAGCDGTYCLYIEVSCPCDKMKPGT